MLAHRTQMGAPLSRPPGLSLLLALITGLAGGLCQAAAVPITHGVASGEIRPTSVLIWARAADAALLQVQVLGPGGDPQRAAAAAEAARDYTARVQIRGLRPDTAYRYLVWADTELLDTPPAAARQGSFHTPPPPSRPAAVRFAWGGDLGGQNICRDAELGYPIVQAIRETKPDFFLALGDMIYADHPCRAEGALGNAQIASGLAPARRRSDYWAHWKYQRADGGLQQLLAETPYLATWDDHEVRNNFGPLHDLAPGTDTGLLPAGLRAFLDYHPIAKSAPTPLRIYRSLRWGAHLELFVLDTRQYRDANSAPDHRTRPKTLLGREQLSWLKTRVAASNATWKVIASSVPLTVPTSSRDAGRDGWANGGDDTGFETELIDLLAHLREAGVRNLLFLSGDVHFATVLRLAPFAETPDFRLYEYVSGPLHAGAYPRDLLDHSLRPERLFLHDPGAGEPPADVADALRWFNFGELAIAADGVLHSRLRDATGRLLYEGAHRPR